MDQNISSKLQVVEFKPGALLFSEGEESYHFYIIQEGEVEIFKNDEQGQKIPLARAGAGTSVGEFAHIDKKARSANVAAINKVSAVLVTQEAYNELLEGLPSWAISMIENLVERLRETDERIRLIKGMDQRQKSQLEAFSNTATGGTIVHDLSKDFGE